MKRCSSVNPDRVSNPVRVVLPRLHERLQTIGNAPDSFLVQLENAPGRILHKQESGPKRSQKEKKHLQN
ncbi:hypothetical protein KsCSTR_47940 [Candidatus Kuenenia stuttgartiensis]|jgi:hypothetical protein|uniref:Uncharacterized protein n=1 Tax=Kuenenia stuttgartiensis TaxID=174633 RepID=A0A2C9CGF6_KUEST|nr:hypothetical protein KsCSTR_47940 [Candidatus Kuenenia stuttgartiensis]SOH04771.1 hypothetical protein KSMBR1_2276 [Candidatus Kuenenia stuttgartiensis]